MIGKGTKRLGCGVLALGALYLQSPYRLGVVCGDSMAPSLQSGRPFLIDRLAYRNQSPRRGDVVVFVRDGHTYVKRVAAVEGDRFVLLKYYQDGSERPLHAWEAGKLRRCVAFGIPLSARLVNRRMPSGCCYVLGDHMFNSEDSRQFGAIPLDQIRGKLLFAPTREPDLEMVSTPFPAHP